MSWSSRRKKKGPRNETLASPKSALSRSGGCLIHVFARLLLLCVSLFDMLPVGDAQRWSGYRRKWLRAHGTDLDPPMVNQMRRKQLRHNAHNSTLDSRCTFDLRTFKLRYDYRTQKTRYMLTLAPDWVRLGRVAPTAYAESREDRYFIFTIYGPLRHPPYPLRIKRREFEMMP